MKTNKMAKKAPKKFRTLKNVASRKTIAILQRTVNATETGRQDWKQQIHCCQCYCNFQDDSKTAKIATKT